MNIHVEATKLGLALLHTKEGNDHYCVAARKHPTSEAPEVCGVSEACKTANSARRQALDRATENLANYNPDDNVALEEDDGEVGNTD